MVEGAGKAVTERAGLARRRRPVVDLVERFALVGLFVIVFISFSGMNPNTFATATNIRNVLAGQSVLGVVALASIIPLVSGKFDLSVGAMLGLASAVSAKLLADANLPLVIALVAGVAASTLVGAANGVLITRYKLNALITTLGTATILTGVTFGVTNGLTIIQGIPLLVGDFGASQAFGIPSLALVLAFLAVAVWFLLTQTPFGRRLEAIGANADAARLVGINVERSILLAFVLSGLLSGLAGLLSLAAMGAADPQQGPNFLLPALAAAFLGATTIHPGRYNVPGTILAVFFLAFAVNGLNLLGLSSDIQSIFNGATLIVAVAISTVVRRHRGN